MDDFIAKISVDPELQSYTGYLPDGWSNIPPLDLGRRGSVLDRQVFMLGLAWRTTGYVASGPLTMVKGCQSSLIGYASVRSPDMSLVTFGDGVLRKVSQRVPEFVEDSKIRAKLMEALVNVADEFRATREAVKLEMPLEPMWQDFLKEYPFSMTVWASQQLAYVAFYNAYEAFLVDCIKCVLGVDSLRSSEKAFMKALRESFGVDLSGYCWGSREVSIGREVRHSLSHGGGKPTKALAALKPDILLVDGLLQIWPKDNKELVAGLIRAVGELVKAGARHPRLNADFVA